MILKPVLVLKSFYMIIKQQSKIKDIGGSCIAVNDAVQTHLFLVTLYFCGTPHFDLYKFRMNIKKLAPRENA